ncbi:bis(5'-nucleosyl)-tetraphosphatase PrpE [Planococcus maitriensis]|uniref:Bis(5'-nucleosyl)-tetraphosphatase PrpE n=1 Tax=Planococcus maitriensis TaxID=221799 RepID=A0A365KAR1_9BACL|nr:bis(5'-nucleosyl)-tetraphosphatase PrpE [Planococcus maitriensis]RAZ69893.1 bis(5'-nucleosyl)-tetraphosphatase PrpE [Planococcus maitriensis]
MKYDVIGDIHGCFDELAELIEQLGYRFENGLPVHPEGRNLAFVGDAMDRGPESLAVLRLLFAMQDAGILYYSPGNHCNKLYRFFKGNPVELLHGLEVTVAEWRGLDKREQKKFQDRYLRFYEALPLYHQLRDELIVVHAGLRQDMIGKALSRKMITFALYGEITGKYHADGRPVRGNWAKGYKGDHWIVYGHTPVETPYFQNNTVNIDTGCVFGGALTALRFPEMDIHQVPSRQPYQPDRFHHYD